MNSGRRGNAQGAKGKLRCAIYTRKSSDEGLEQDFNSLDAQREACEAYIRSQKHEGWVVIETLYDDGGVSGATMERPALKRLLADIAARKVDSVVTYKIDRLTRTLTDFAKIVEVFDAHGVSFVSVTQQFNTTTSMGRLTLNVLLSFAQFEREVTSERIRDKIAASKKKGLWMGGVPPLGYDCQDRKLVVNEEEAKTLRHIYRRYAELGSLLALKEALDAQGIVSKLRVSQAGRRSGSNPIARGALYLMLQNRIYRGEIVHKDKSYPGQHKAIVDQDLWDRVQARLAVNRVERQTGARAKSPSLFVGLLHDDKGLPMTPSHAVKNGKRYRYYVTRPLTTQHREAVPDGRRVPAGDIEQIVVSRLRAFLSSAAEIHEAVEPQAKSAIAQKSLIVRAAALAGQWPEQTPAQIRQLLSALVARIDLRPGQVEIYLLPERLGNLLTGDASLLSPASAAAEDAPRLTLCTPARLRRAGMEMTMLIDAKQARKGKPDPSLVKLIVKAQKLKEHFIRGGDRMDAIAESAGVSRAYFARLVKLSFLAPDITKAILEGRHPPGLTASRLINHAQLPLDWKAQRTALGFT
jgi:DNA invertase Pin-like site-specific DNA recombinase